MQMVVPVAQFPLLLNVHYQMDNLELTTRDSEQYYDLTEISFGVRFLTLAAEKFAGSTGATGVLIS